MHHRDRLDGVAAVLGEPRLDACGVGAGAPVAVEDLDGEAEPARHLRPQRGEVPGLAHQHRVAGRERVHERRLPGAGAGRRKDQHVAAGAEDLTQAREHLLAEAPEFRPAVVDGRALDRAQDSVWHVGGTGNLEEVPAGRSGHKSESPESRSAARPVAARSVRLGQKVVMFRSDGRIGSILKAQQGDGSVSAKFCLGDSRVTPNSTLKGGRRT